MAPVLRNGNGLNVVAIAVLLGSIAIGILASAAAANPAPAVVMIVVGLVAMMSPKIAQQWERAVVLRLGRFVGLHGPGLFQMPDDSATYNHPVGVAAQRPDVFRLADTEPHAQGQGRTCDGLDRRQGYNTSLARDRSQNRAEDQKVPGPRLRPRPKAPIGRKRS